MGAASSFFIQSYSNLAETFNTSIALDKKVVFKVIAGFFDKYAPLFKLSFKNFAFLIHFMKNYARVEISTKKDNL